MHEGGGRSGDASLQIERSTTSVGAVGRAGGIAMLLPPALVAKSRAGSETGGQGGDDTPRSSNDSVASSLGGVVPSGPSRSGPSRSRLGNIRATLFTKPPPAPPIATQQSSLRDQQAGGPDEEDEEEEDEEEEAASSGAGSEEREPVAELPAPGPASPAALRQAGASSSSAAAAAPSSSAKRKTRIVWSDDSYDTSEVLKPKTPSSPNAAMGQAPIGAIIGPANPLLPSPQGAGRGAGSRMWRANNTDNANIDGYGANPNLAPTTSVPAPNRGAAAAAAAPALPPVAQRGEPSSLSSSERDSDGRAVAEAAAAQRRGADSAAEQGSAAAAAALELLAAHQGRALSQHVARGMLQRAAAGEAQPAAAMPGEVARGALSCSWVDVLPLPSPSGAAGLLEAGSSGPMAEGAQSGLGGGPREGQSVKGSFLGKVKSMFGPTMSRRMTAEMLRTAMEGRVDDGRDDDGGALLRYFRFEQQGRLLCAGAWARAVSAVWVGACLVPQAPSPRPTRRSGTRQRRS